MKDFAVFFFSLLFVFALVAVLPFAAIWSLNTLFGLGIAYTGWTWLAAFVLIALLRGGASPK